MVFPIVIAPSVKLSSGLKNNFFKCNLFGVNIQVDILHCHAEFLRFKLYSKSFSYLGIPVRSVNVDWFWGGMVRRIGDKSNTRWFSSKINLTTGNGSMISPRFTQSNQPTIFSILGFNNLLSSSIILSLSGNLRLLRKLLPLSGEFFMIESLLRMLLFGGVFLFSMANDIIFNNVQPSHTQILDSARLNVWLWIRGNMRMESSSYDD
ncbi:hypothetical protein Lal_00024922 [Lupinus albus]|nr:hypothetical protein Lal_00024922 [Lupinus albus]